MTARTLYDKLWDDHVVHTEEDGTAVLYIDRHLVHEVTSPQAYEGLRQAGRKVWRVSSVVATADHNTPTTGWERGYDGIEDPISKEQVTTLDANIAEFGAAASSLLAAARHRARDRSRERRHPARHDGRLRRLHTSTHGAFGAAHGIGSEVIRAGHADPAGQEGQEPVIKVKAAAGRHRQDIVLAIIGRMARRGMG